MPALVELALQVLHTADIDEKAELTRQIVADWQQGRVREVWPATSPPPAPPRVPARRIPEPRGATVSKVKGIPAFVHSLVHAEGYAIDLSWDIIVRFPGERMPVEFANDWVRVAGEEAKHYFKWKARLAELGYAYGDMATHEGLWESALDTAHDLRARLAVVHMVHEARGLDVFPQAMRRLQGDATSAAILTANYQEEITHVGAGTRWFCYVCHRDGADPVRRFHELVRRHFRGLLKPPFNEEARAAAGMSPEWYWPLTEPCSSTHAASLAGGSGAASAPPRAPVCGDEIGERLALWLQLHT